MKNTLIICLFVLTMLASVGVAAARTEYRTGTVTRIIDGDTIMVRNVGTVRLVGINAPERGRRNYRRSIDFLNNYALNLSVRVRVNTRRLRDRFGRIRGVVIAGRLNLNRELVRRGYARQV